MDNENQKYLNVTFKNEEQEKEDIILSFGTIFKMLKKFLALWVVLAVLIGILIPVYSLVFAADQHKKLTAVISFNYDGIENGLAPDGNPLDVTTIKNPAVIEATLTELNLPLDGLEIIRQGLIINGIVPADAADQITMYKSVFEEGNLNAGISMINTAINPTQYRVIFDYAATGFSGEEAVNFLNTMLDRYRVYFFELYGYNEALGNTVVITDYNTYDYAQAVDIFSNSLTTLQQYVNRLANQDNTHFRSTTTGYTFSDLSSAISTLKNVDLDQISSYVTVNNVTQDKNSLIDYYNYRIEALARQRNIAQDELKQINESIQSYEKDIIIIYGSEQDSSQYTKGSVTYDKMFDKKIEAQNTVSSTTQQINMYQQRVNALKSSSVAPQDKMEKVEKDLASLNARTLDLLQKVDDTANEYYDTVYLGNAYSILVPAATSAITTTSSVLKFSLKYIFIAEALLVVLYIAVAFIKALLQDNKKSPLPVSPSVNENGHDDVASTSEEKD